MALQNEILVGRFNRALQKLLGMKGGPPAPQLSPEFVPRLNVPTGQEEAYLWGYDLFGVTISQGGTVGAVSSMQVRNPLGTKVAIEMVRILVNNIGTADGGMALRLGADDGGSLGTPVTTVAAWDRRGRQNSTLLLTTGSGGLTGVITILSFNIGASTNAELIAGIDKDLIPLLPGTKLGIQGTILNNPFNASFWWRERPLEESELA